MAKLIFFLLLLNFPSIAISMEFNIIKKIFQKEINIKIIPFNPHLNTVYLVVTGDIIPHGAVKRSGRLKLDGTYKTKPDFTNMFKGIKPLIKQSDIAFANFETPHKPDTLKNIYKSIPYQFNIPIEMIKTLKDIGFTVFSLANNHLYDQGKSGIESTTKILNKYNFLHTGAGKSCQEAIKPVIIEKKGIKIGFLAFTTWINNDKNHKGSCRIEAKNYPHINRYNKKLAIKAIKNLKKKVDFVIVSTHWGHEYHKKQSWEQEQKAKVFLKAGADLILGHHPHVLQPLVYKNGKYIVYSMGNFISNQFFKVRSRHARHKKANREGIIYRFEIGTNNGKIKKIKYKPIYIYKEKLKKNPKKFKEPYRILLKQPKKSSKEYKSIVKFIGPTTIETEKMQALAKQLVLTIIQWSLAH